MMMPPTHLTLHSIAVMDNPLCLIGAADHPWAKRKTTALRHLGGADLLMREAGSGTRQATLEFLAQHRLAPRIRMTLGSNEAIKHAVAAGLGLAVLSRHAIAKDPAADGLSVLRMAGLPIRSGPTSCKGPRPGPRTPATPSTPRSTRATCQASKRPCARP